MDRRIKSERVGRVAVLAALVMAVACAAGAQGIPSSGGRVFGLVGGSFGDGGTIVMTSGSAGVRLTRQLGFDFELLHLPGVELGDDDFITQFGWLPRVGQPSLLPVFDIDRDGSITTFLTKLTVDFPVAGDRLVPYVTGGGGAGRLRETTSVTIRPTPFPTASANLPALRGRRLSIFPPRPFDRSETGLALTIGGGGDVMLWQGPGIGADVRWMRLLVNREDIDVATVGARVSYRF